MSFFFYSTNVEIKCGLGLGVLGFLFVFFFFLVLSKVWMATPLPMGAKRQKERKEGGAGEQRRVERF